jgi:hypothetical protein
MQGIAIVENVKTSRSGPFALFLLTIYIVSLFIIIDIGFETEQHRRWGRTDEMARSNRKIDVELLFQTKPVAEIRQVRCNYSIFCACYVWATPIQRTHLIWGLVLSLCIADRGTNK